jgi:hypothetical protein
MKIPARASEKPTTFLKDLPPPDSQKSTVARIDSEWERLYKFKFHYWDRYIGYLFVLNAGGLLAILIHMGVSGIQAVNAGHKATLLCFFKGIVLSLLLNVLLVHLTRTILAISMMRSWVMRIYSNKPINKGATSNGIKFTACLRPWFFRPFE